MTFSRVLWKGMRPRLVRHAAIAAATAASLGVFLCVRPAPGASILADCMLFLLLSTLLYQAYVIAVMVGMLFSARAELRRKTAHVLGGGVLVVAAGLTAGNGVVVALCVLLLGWLVATRVLPSLKMYRQLSVDRRDGSVSWGDLWFPVGLGAAAMLFGVQSAEWLAAALVLTLADSAAAVTGTRFPGAVYRVAGGNKSLGGSCAFLIVTWSSIALAGWVSGGEWPWLACAGLAAVLTGLEAISSRGLDNVSLPLATAAGLYWIDSVPAVAWLTAGLAGLLLLAALAVRQRSVRLAILADQSGLQTK
ncbi:hypothetical protein WAB97_005755 [Stenotrophomonas maltophilia]|uniref:hypothetical protein n=1 Tax=Stenotrophomonas maltophilia TaxID=40324 RepID=UPI00332E9832